MTTASKTPPAPPSAAGATLTRPGLPRLTVLELRKSVDTRAGAWVAVTGVAVGDVAALALAFLGDAADRSLVSLSSATLLALSLVTPIICVLMITGEWGQRTIGTTFTLVPSRPRVVVAKTAAVALVGLALVPVALVQAALSLALASASGRAATGWTLTPEQVARLFLVSEIGAFSAAAVAFLTLSTVAALAVLFVVQPLFSMLAAQIPGLRSATPWIDLGQAFAPYVEAGGPLTSDDWLHLASASAIWVLLPMLVGVVRVLRCDPR